MELFSPVIMEVHFENKADKIKADFLRYKLYMLQKNFYQELARTNKELQEIVGTQLEKQYLQNHEARKGSLIISQEYDYIYMFDENLKLVCINGEEQNKYENLTND